MWVLKLQCALECPEEYVTKQCCAGPQLQLFDSVGFIRGLKYAFLLLRSQDHTWRITRSEQCFSNLMYSQLSQEFLLKYKLSFIGTDVGLQIPYYSVNFTLSSEGLVCEPKLRSKHAQKTL